MLNFIDIVAIVSAVYRPVTLDELASFVTMPDGVSSDYKTLLEIIQLCGSFLTLRDIPFPLSVSRQRTFYSKRHLMIYFLLE
jgi:hypothetical protein